MSVAIESLDDGVEVEGGHTAHVEGEGFEEKLGYENVAAARGGVKEAERAEENTAGDGGEHAALVAYVEDEGECRKESPSDAAGPVENGH